VSVVVGMMAIEETYWMLSNHETRERMRCKLIENLQFDSHFEASRLRDYSCYTSYIINPNDETNTSLQLANNNDNNSNNNNNNNKQQQQDTYENIESNKFR